MICEECINNIHSNWGCNEEGEDFTSIEIDCPVCGFQDAFGVWGSEYTQDELIEEVIERYDSL